MMNGFTNDNWAKNLPGTLYYTLDRDILQKINDSKLVFLQKENVHDEYILSSLKVWMYMWWTNLV